MEAITSHRDKEWLQEQYHENELSQRQVAEKAGVSRDTIKYWFKKHGVQTRNLSDAHSISFQNDNPDDIQIDVIDGMLLGDGCLEYQGTSARYRLCVKHKEHAELEKRELESMGFECKMRQVRYTNDQECWPDDIVSWHMWTLNYPCLGDLHERWYGSGQKQVPNDIKVTPRGLLFWYIGDGALSQQPNGSAQCTLSTNSFIKSDVQLLSQRLANLEIGSSLNQKREKEYILRISNDSVPVLLDAIGPCPPILHDVYQYKWRFP